MAQVSFSATQTVSNTFGCSVLSQAPVLPPQSFYGNEAPRFNQFPNFAAQKKSMNMGDQGTPLNAAQRKQFSRLLRQIWGIWNNGDNDVPGFSPSDGWHHQNILTEQFRNFLWSLAISCPNPQSDDWVIKLFLYSIPYWDVTPDS
jgi:hypothetical protein